jgi:4-oxalocrotonate tautomerase family enzyme
MAQIKIYGLKSHLRPIQQKLSDVLHGCIVDKLQYPVEKRAHRFIALDPEDFIYMLDRSEAYTIIEISMFEGRTVETKKTLIHAIFERFEAELGISPQDVEITIFETPRHNWGIRGKTGDELALNYKVDV